MTSPFTLGDLVKYKDVLCEIVFINQDHAWISPLQDYKNLKTYEHKYAGLVCAKINRAYVAQDGTQTTLVENDQCKAL